MKTANYSPLGHDCMEVLKFLSANELLNCLNWRYAVKQFDAERKIPINQWAVLERALVLSPSSYGLQPWKFMVIDDLQMRQRLLLSAMGQRQIVDCSHLVVFAARTSITETDISHWLDRVATVRDIPEVNLDTNKATMKGDLVTGPRHEIAAEWAKRQAYLALGVFLASAAVIGIDTCPMEGFDPKAFDEILGFPALGYTTAVIATAGFRSPNDHTANETKVRFPLNEIILRR